MSINACIYDADHALVGCITDSVVEMCRNEFESIKKRHFGWGIDPVLAVMEKSLIQTADKMGADFLNCLKLVTRKYRGMLPEEFVRETSRAYHAIVRHCCSQQVEDEVMEETLDQFRKAGFDYIGANSQGFEQKDCKFEYKGHGIAIRMRDRADLYRMWSSEDTCTEVKVCIGGEEWKELLPGSPLEIADETIRFIENVTACGEEEVAGVDGILAEIVAIIEELLADGNRDC